MCVTLNSSFLLIAQAVRGRFPQTRDLLSGQAWANAWDVLRCKPSRGGRGRRAAMGFVVCFGWVGISFRFARSRVFSVDSMKGQRQSANLPTENFTYPYQVYRLLCSHLRNTRVWRHQLISKVTHSPGGSNPPRPFQHIFSSFESASRHCSRDRALRLTYT